MNNYSDFLQLFSKHLNNYSESLVHSKPKELYHPSEYILNLGGKRIRPLLALVAADLCEQQVSKALDAALAVELFHNFSLIHDDILDAAPKRRNKKTVHQKWNTNIAILSGDLLLVKAFEVLQNYPSKISSELNKIFTQTASQVCEGQQLDMNFETQKNVGVEDYIHMISLKTAVLLGCSLQMGAIAAGANKKFQSTIYLFGKHLGIAFQLMDDYLDVFAEAKNKFGKQIGGDIISNKKTFLLLKAKELAKGNVKTQLENLLNNKTISTKEKVEKTKALYKTLSVDSICNKEAEWHTIKALQMLNELKIDSTKKENLKLFALHLLNRHS